MTKMQMFIWDASAFAIKTFVGAMVFALAALLVGVLGTALAIAVGAY